MDDELALTEVELEALARMLVIMLRVDGQTSPEETAAVQAFASRVRVPGLQPFLDRAALVPPSRDEFTRAAQVITNRPAQEAIYAALYDVSAADTVVRQEWDLLKVLVDLWNIEV